MQRSAARFIVNDYNYTSSVSQMISALNWQTLEQSSIWSSLLYFSARPLSAVGRAMAYGAWGREFDPWARRVLVMI